MDKEVISKMTKFTWNERLQDELVWHLSAKQSLDKEQHTELWALADGNSRGLKKAQKTYYHSESREYAVDKIRQELESAIRRHRKGEFIINSDNEELAEMLGEGYIQGMVRAYTIAVDLHDPTGSPPQDLSAFRGKLLTEVN